MVYENIDVHAVAQANTHNAFWILHMIHAYYFCIKVNYLNTETEINVELNVAEAVIIQ